MPSITLVLPIAHSPNGPTILPQLDRKTPQNLGDGLLQSFVLRFSSNFRPLLALLLFPNQIHKIGPRNSQNTQNFGARRRDFRENAPIDDWARTHARTTDPPFGFSDFSDFSD
jgi:hypothetical protein